MRDEVGDGSPTEALNEGRGLFAEIVVEGVGLIDSLESSESAGEDAAPPLGGAEDGLLRSWRIGCGLATPFTGASALARAPSRQTILLSESGHPWKTSRDPALQLLSNDRRMASSRRRQDKRERIPRRQTVTGMVADDTLLREDNRYELCTDAHQGRFGFGPTYKMTVDRITIDRSPGPHLQ